MRQNCHLQCRSCPGGRKKEAGNQWSCINLLTANVLHILILDPFPAAPQTNHHCALGPHLSPYTLLHSQRCHIRRGKSTTPSFFEEGRSNCHLEMCLAGLGPQHNRLKREKGKKLGVRGGVETWENQSVFGGQLLTLVVIVIISQFVSQVWLEWYGKSGKERESVRWQRSMTKGRMFEITVLNTHLHLSNAGRTHQLIIFSRGF